MSGSIDIDFVPETAEELAACLADPWWRICSGQLYKIMVKDDGAAEGFGVMPFRPNRAQKRLIRSLWFRNLILKARQLGFTTLVSILWLDHALFNPNQRCGIVAHDKDAAENIFRDKVRFAYENLPDALRAEMPLGRDSAKELLFAHNNSSIRVATSMRSGTIHRLLVSEFGKICAKFPDKAREVVTGSLPAVPLNGIAIIESTAEGQGGSFHDMAIQAEARSKQVDRPLTKREWRFHFAAWWKNPEYQMDPAGVIITAKDHEYFDTVEAAANTVLSLRQRAWYCATRESDFAGSAEKMWQEYPSTPKEAFQQSTEGTYYHVQLTAARKSGRIGKVPFVSHVPVNSFWDIGNRDGTAIWLHQHVGLEHRFIGFIEGWGEPFDYYVKEMEKLGYLWGRHFLPHDAEQKKQLGTVIASPLSMLEELRPTWNFEIVPRVADITHGIQLTRNMFSQAWFDETACADGIAHLGAYSKERDPRLGVFKPTPRHDIHSEGADAFRQWAQGWSTPATPAGVRPNRSRNRSAMAA